MNNDLPKPEVGAKLSAYEQAAFRPQPEPAVGHVWLRPHECTLHVIASVAGERVDFDDDSEWTSVCVMRERWTCMGVETPAGRVMVGERRQWAPDDATVLRVLGADAQYPHRVLIRLHNGKEEAFGATTIAMLPLVTEPAKPELADMLEGLPPRAQQMARGAFLDTARTVAPEWVAAPSVGSAAPRPDESDEVLRTRVREQMAAGADAIQIDGPVDGRTRAIVYETIQEWRGRRGGAWAWAPRIEPQPLQTRTAAVAVTADGRRVALPIDGDGMVRPGDTLTVSEGRLKIGGAEVRTVSAVAPWEARRREIDAALREDARAHPAFATARTAAVLCGIETREDYFNPDGATTRTVLRCLHHYESLRGGMTRPSPEAVGYADEEIGSKAIAAYERSRALP